ncbi:unnamed protein product [Chironomus riparius]|uniref:Uncharacterized protein n=1 Tax=Chironomus riparius TaxID=315576 RepID=A0A9N9RM57_9DIPT|nr:unnamed protein product [Chironomus riparius]
MIILLYLIVITGWALLILIIKCRKAREKRIALERQQAQLQNAVHVIQIGNQFYDVIPVSRCHHSNSRCRSYHIRHSDSNSHINPTFVLDEGVYPSASASSIEAPPSYDDVIRLPNQYPKRNSSNNENPPTLEEIERVNSNTTINSQSTAIFITSQDHNLTTNRDTTLR